MTKKRKFNGRTDAEASEGYKTVQTDLPSGRFSTSKQIVSADEMGVTSASTPSDTTNVSAQAAKSLKSKMKVRPDVSVDDLGDKQVGGVPLAVSTDLRNVAGARTQSTVDDMSRTPYSPGNYRPDTRYGKKRSEDLFELDNAPIEQVVPKVEDLDDLRAAPDSEVGYNGRQQFKQQRQKKNFSFTPAGAANPLEKLPQQLLNEASLDFADKNAVVYTTGQVVTDIANNNTGVEEFIDAAADYPTTTFGSAIPDEEVMHKSNYIPTNLRLRIQNGHITEVNIHEYRFSAPANPVTRDEANTNWQIDANNVAKTMVKIQKEMGRETTDKWTPLAYVIHEPYQYNMLLHDIEATTGAIMATAYRSAVSSLAYQRNIVKKDGVNPARNGVKMMIEGYAGVMANNNRNTISDLDFAHSVFNERAYREGSAAALIAMFDSTGKYQTKADILGLQRSLPLHLSQADNNISPLHVKPNFMRALDKAHMFSTIDGTYNPYLPIFETKQIKLCNPLSLNKFLLGWTNPSLASDELRAEPSYCQKTGSLAQYAYSYTDLRNSYDTYIYHPVIEGMLEWMLRHEGAIVRTYGEGYVNIPFHFDFQSPNMLSFMLCSAAQYVAFNRNIIYRDVLFAGEQSTYIWDDLKALSDIDPLYSTQLKIGKYDQPLTLGKLAPDSAIRLMYGDSRQLAEHQNNHVQYFEPWHWNEQAMAATAGGNYTIVRGFKDGDHPFNFSFPSIRDGVRHEYVDLIKSMSPKDIMLSLDRKLSLLPYTSITEHRDSTNQIVLWDDVVPYTGTNVNQDKIEISALRYDGNSDGRIVTRYNLTEGSNLPLYAIGHYCIPKEIGFIDDWYFGISVITGTSYSHNEWVVTTATDTFDTVDHNVGGDTPYYNGGNGFWLTSYRMEPNGNADLSIDRSASLTSTFYRFFAANDNATIRNLNTTFIQRTGICPTRSYNGGTALVIPAVYNIRSTQVSTHADDTNILSDAQYVWTVLQRWMAPINPFANAFTVSNSSCPYDPCETAFWFGVCGFLAADYTQAVLTRLSLIDQLGMDYTEDPNQKDSLIFR